MVQLKSFKFIEPDGPEEQQRSVNLNYSDNQQVQHDDDDDALEQQQQQQSEVTTKRERLPSASSSSTLTSPETSSQQSISTIAGGNLTIESSQPDEQENVPPAPTPTANTSATTTTTITGSRSPTSNSRNSIDSSASTILSASEEYQQAKYDIVEEDDDDCGGDNNNTTTRINIDSGKFVATNISPQVPFVKRPFVTSKSAPQIASLAARHHHQVAGFQGQRFTGAGQSPLVGNRRPLSPVLAARQARLANQAGDSISQYSFGGQRQANYSHHFEIRWHNISLMARRSKLPRFITDNNLFKILKGKQDPAKIDKKIYYSPPLNRRTISVIPEIVPLDYHQNQSLKVSDTKTNQTSNDLNMDTGEFRPILTNISGSVFSGQLTAILGPSGVGKTSLLNSLTGRNTLDGTGKVSLLGATARKRMSVVTVPQADILPGRLTTLEDLRFTSRLKNPQNGFDHLKNINRIVRHLQMEKFLNTRIDKLSGGEQRRLSIGRELLNSPDIMILDEPTSGLDAMTCKKIIMALRDIVEHSDNILDRPMSIIVTIHQPQQEVLNQFHRLYIMALGGCAIYEGPPSNLLSHLIENSSLSSATQIEQLNENPAIVAIEVASGEYGSEIIAELAHYHELTANDYFSGVGENDNELGTVGQSPYLTPRSLRAPKKSPLSVSPRFDAISRKAQLQAGRLAAATNPALGMDGISMSGSVGLRTPTLANKNKHHHKHHHHQHQTPPAGLQFDRMSSVTSLSYASTYDADLPDQTSRLKVDKRLRRSVVIKGDFFNQTITLMHRCWILTTRDIFLMLIRILGFLLVAAGIVQIFSHALDGDENQCPVYQSEVDDIMNFMSAIRLRLAGLQETLQQATSTHTLFFHLTLCTTVVSSALAGLIFPIQMRMFIREYKNGWYSPGAFITSSTIAELPIDMIGPILTILIVYPLCHQPDSDYHWREIGYILTVIVSTLICKSQAQVCGAFLMDSVENSVFISCVMVTPPALLSGIAIRVSQMPKMLQYLSYTSFLRYTHEILFLLRYGYGLCPCDPNIINGYPVMPTTNAIPERLDTFARGVMDLNGSGNVSLIDTNAVPIDEFDNSLFVRYIRLVTDASNLFMPNAQELGDCNKYRSLYLLQQNIDDRIIHIWFPILILLFIISRIITYFVVKIVIKMRRQ